MSKQSEAKKNQGYNPKLIPPMCMNCDHYESDMLPVSGFSVLSYLNEKNIRCGIGGFAVKKMGTCALHEFKKEQP